MSETKEQRKKYNSERSNLFCVVIHVPFGQVFFPDENLLNSFCRNWALCLHDLDCVSDGSLDFQIKSDFPTPIPLKPTHYHFVIELPSRSYSSAVNKLFQSVFKLPDYCISVEKCLNLTLSLRYLIHMDNPEKYQYPFQRIRTSDFVWLVSHMQNSEKAIQEFVYDSLKKCQGDYSFLLDTLGLTLCKKYYQIINQYFRCYYFTSKR